MKKFHHVGLGGTFDRLHSGHKSLIDLAFIMAHRVSFGIARKICSKDKFLSANIESYIIRQRAVEDYLKSKKLLDRALFFPLDDIYGTAKTDKTLEVIIVSKETYPNALKINQFRKQNNLLPLKIIVAPYVLADDGKKIASGRIRGGEIDREGNSYQLLVRTGQRPVRTHQEKKLILPEHLREELRKPLGKVFHGQEEEGEKTAKKIVQSINRLDIPLVISVGDAITMSLLKIGFDPDVKIIDFRVRRKKINSLYLSDRTQKVNLGKTTSDVVKNQPGTIALNIVSVFRRVIKKFFKTKQKQLIIVNGEEDLVTLPAVLLAPLGSIVLYGQMDLGVVAVSVTEEKKKEVLEILKKFI